MPVAAIAKMAARGIWSKWLKISYGDTEDDRCGKPEQCRGQV
jgi:hypothetical protein